MSRPYEMDPDFWKDPKDRDPWEDGDVALLDPETDEDELKKRKQKGNAKELVLGASPEAYQCFDLLSEVSEMVKKRLQLGIYSPHEDRMQGRHVGEIMEFLTDEAIPSSKLVILSLAHIDRYLYEISESVFEDKARFLFFRPTDIVVSSYMRKTHCSQTNYIGEVAYSDPLGAVSQLEDFLKNVPDLRG